MLKIPLGFPDTSAFPEHGIRFGGIDAFYITMDASSIQKTENMWQDLCRTLGRDVEEEVNDFIAKNGLSDWTWTGRWFSIEETSYAQFQKPQVEPSD